MQVCVDVYKRISSDSEIDRARTETILNIAKYVRSTRTHSSDFPNFLNFRMEVGNRML